MSNPSVTIRIEPPLEHERGHEDGQHQKGEADLDGCAEREPDPRGEAGLAGACQPEPGAQLPQHGADERTKNDSGEPEKEAEEGAQRGARHRVTAGAKVLRPEGRGHQIDEVARDADDADEDERAHTDLGEVPGPGAEREAREDEHVPRQSRKDNPEEADEHDRDGERPQKDGHTILTVSLTIISAQTFADHLTPPGHPERVERAEVMHAVASEFRRAGTPVVDPGPASIEDLVRIHDPEYVGLIRETAGRAVALDPDTFTSPATWEVARLAAGAAIAGIDHVLDAGAGARAAVLVRPPGHHAERNRAMGFCFFNNIAIAAAYARARGVRRVAILDFDAHHGNGTQASFYDDPSVLFVSSHQYPYYPGTGAARDVGTGAGSGFTVNLPLEVGATDADYELVYSRVALPIVTAFKPELVLVSAGFDAHEDDPLAGMRVTSACFGRLTAAIARAADACCEGRLVAVTEGGYDLAGLAGSLRATLRALEGDSDAFAAPQGAPTRGEVTLESATSQLSKYWQL